MFPGRKYCIIFVLHFVLHRLHFGFKYSIFYRNKNFKNPVFMRSLGF
nr:MAG TPA: hypothetical protein [Caudoviricetes sp.]